MLYKGNTGLTKEAASAITRAVGKFMKAQRDGGDTIALTRQIMGYPGSDHAIEALHRRLLKGNAADKRVIVQKVLDGTDFFITSGKHRQTSASAAKGTNQLHGPYGLNARTAGHYDAASDFIANGPDNLPYIDKKEKVYTNLAGGFQKPRDTIGTTLGNVKGRALPGVTALRSSEYTPYLTSPFVLKDDIRTNLHSSYEGDSIYDITTRFGIADVGGDPNKLLWKGVNRGNGAADALVQGSDVFYGGHPEVGISYLKPSVEDPGLLLRLDRTKIPQSVNDNLLYTPHYGIADNNQRQQYLDMNKEPLFGHGGKLSSIPTYEVVMKEGLSPDVFDLYQVIKREGGFDVLKVLNKDGNHATLNQLSAIIKQRRILKDAHAQNKVTSFLGDLNTTEMKQYHRRALLRDLAQHQKDSVSTAAYATAESGRSGKLYDDYALAAADNPKVKAPYFAPTEEVQQIVKDYKQQAAAFKARWENDPVYLALTQGKQQNHLDLDTTIADRLAHYKKTGKLLTNDALAKYTTKY